MYTDINDAKYKNTNQESKVLYICSDLILKSIKRYLTLCRFVFDTAISVAILNTHFLDQVYKPIDEDLVSPCWRKETRNISRARGKVFIANYL